MNKAFFFSFKCKKTPALSGSSQSRPALEKTVPSSLIEKALIRPIFVQMKPRRCCERLLAARAPCPERDNQSEARFYPVFCKAPGIVDGGDSGGGGGACRSVMSSLLSFGKKVQTVAAAWEGRGRGLEGREGCGGAFLRFGMEMCGDKSCPAKCIMARP